jgi:hypothetical protein
MTSSNLTLLLFGNELRVARWSALPLLSCNSEMTSHAGVFNGSGLSQVGYGFGANSDPEPLIFGPTHTWNRANLYQTYGNGLIHGR